jgi:2-hydroxycyclohexanecarboxyl-CoA dehydrogenase
VSEDLEGRVALVTGGGGGIGSLIAHELHDMGARVIVAGRRKHVLDQACEGRPNMSPLELDVTDQASWDSAADQLREVDVLVTSAAVITRARFMESDPADWERMWRTNVYGSMMSARNVLPGMLSRGYGRIVLVSSVAGHVGLLDRTAYSATKGAIEAFGRSLAREVASTGVTVNTLAPGAFRTELNAEYLKDGSPGAMEALAMIPEKRFGDPVELAAAVRFLVVASYSQGHTVHVDGGWTSGG